MSLSLKRPEEKDSKDDKKQQQNTLKMKRILEWKKEGKNKKKDNKGNDQIN